MHWTVGYLSLLLSLHVRICCAVCADYAEGGLPCTLFFSHAWNEGIFEFIDYALREWPDDCEGAYICFLSNPQNLDIGKLLGDSINASPFYRVLVDRPRPRKMIILSNSNVPIHTRLWCALEAWCCSQLGIPLEISGDPLDLLTGARLGGMNAARSRWALRLPSRPSDARPKSP